MVPSSVMITLRRIKWSHPFILFSFGLGSSLQLSKRAALQAHLSKDTVLFPDEIEGGVELNNLRRDVS